jgi:carboxylesterase
MQHAFRVPDPFQLPHLPIFTHPDHEPFLFEGGKPACLLVHGFPGTSLEMRPLGHCLNEAGWTARGMRLPGFGPDLADVIDFNNETWVRSILDELKTLRDAGHSPLLLVGYSFGGGLSIQAAARLPLDGLVLIAPLTWHEPAGIKVIFDFTRALLPLRFAPFQRIPIVGSHPLDGIEPFFPEIDFESPEQIREFQHLQLPLYVLDQLREVGRKALAAAPEVHTRTLLIQGMQDRVIQPERTNFLHNRLNAPIIYKEVNGAHHLTMPHNPAFEDVKSNVITFAELITSQPKNIKP